MFGKTAAAEGFTQVGADISNLDIGLSLQVALVDQVNAQYKLQSCNSAGCTDSNIVNVADTSAYLRAAITQISPDSVESYSRFGRAIALSDDGSTLAVGAPFEDSASADAPGQPRNDAGAVTIFKKQANGSWNQVAYIPSPAGANSYFGRSIALDADGDVLAVGANGADKKAFNPNSGQVETVTEFAGAVYTYFDDSRLGGWQSMGQITAAEAGRSDSFGYSVALNDSGHVLLVGARHEDSNATSASDNSLENSGAAYVFITVEPHNLTSSWHQTAYLKAANADAEDRFGYSVALDASGDIAVIGAPYEDNDANPDYIDVNKEPENNNGLNTGAAYVFRKNAETGNWQQESYLNGNSRTGHFGFAVAISGNGQRIIASAPEAEVFDEDKAGYVAVYNYVNNERYIWGREFDWIRPRFHQKDDLLGHSIAISADGNRIAVGAPGESGFAAGIHYFSEFTQEEGEGNEESGAAYIFDRKRSILGPWTQLAYLRSPLVSIPNEFLGYDIDLAGDGETVAASRPGLQFSGFGQGKGAVFIY